MYRYQFKIYKRIFLFVAIILLGCSTTDEEALNSNRIDFNPPSWIQGEWLINDFSLGKMGWRFTNNDVILIQSGSEISQREQIELFLDTSENVSGSDKATSTTYEITSKLPGGQILVHSFVKLSENTLTWEGAPGSVYTKQE